MPPRGSSKGGAFRFAASGCRGVTLFVTVDVERAIAALPRPFSPFAAASGKALVVVRSFSSSGLAVDGGPAVAAAVGEVAIRIEAPHATAGSHFYPLRQATSGAALAGRLRAFGVDCALAPFLRIEEQELPGAGFVVTASAPHFSVTVRTSLPAPTEGPADWTCWYPGGRRLVRARFVSVVS
ncbi:MAG: hypothetical protein ACREQ9_26520, partial [Candidatus Binatia bacterium]